MHVGRSGAKLRHTLKVSARAVNVSGVCGSRFSGEQQGTSNEPVHRCLKRNFKVPGGKRKLELLTVLIQLGVYIFNSAALFTVTLGSWLS